MRKIVLTGANSGIGFHAARLFAKEGDRLFILCRPGEKSERALEFIIDESKSTQIELIEVDLSEINSITTALEQIHDRTDHLDVLINNAGLQKKQYTTDSLGVELSLAVNFRAPFMISEGLKELLAKGGSSRIVNVVSELYKNGKFPVPTFSGTKKYNASKAYANSKLAAVLMSQEMTRRYTEHNIDVLCLHPGVLATDALRDYPKLLMKLVSIFLEKPELGGERIYQLATSEKFKDSSGDYIYKDDIRDLVKIAQDHEAQKTAWEYAGKLSK